MTRDSNVNWPAASLVLLSEIAEGVTAVPTGWQCPLLLRVLGRLPLQDDGTDTAAGVGEASREETAGRFGAVWPRYGDSVAGGSGWMRRIS